MLCRQNVKIKHFYKRQYNIVMTALSLYKLLLTPTDPIPSVCLNSQPRVCTRFTRFSLGLGSRTVGLVLDRLCAQSVGV